jgi:hypothetical protein
MIKNNIGNVSAVLFKINIPGTWIKFHDETGGRRTERQVEIFNGVYF